MTRVVLIDDEHLAKVVVKEYLQAYTKIEICAECSDGFEGIKAIMQHQPQLIFLDIQMPKLSGFEMLELIDKPPSVIFTTAYDEYALRAFETHAIDYLLKPFSKDRFDKAMQKWKMQSGGTQQMDNVQKLLEAAPMQPSQAERIVLKTAGKIKIIPLHDVHYFEAADDYVKIITREGSFLKSKTMLYFETTLNGNLFVRCHRSYIVAVQLISRIDLYEKENYLALLSTGVSIPVSKAGYARLRQVLGL